MKFGYFNWIFKNLDLNLVIVLTVAFVNSGGGTLHFSDFFQFW